MLNLRQIVKIFDATFSEYNGKEHYFKRKKEKSIPSDMNQRQYRNKAKEVSLKTINGSSVRAYKVNKNGSERIVKCDGKWLVVYVGGKNGTLVTAFPCSMSNWLAKMRNSKGIEITAKEDR